MASPISGTRHLTRSLLPGATLAAPPRLPSSVHCGESRSACSPRFVSIRCRANRSGSAYSPLNSSSNFSDRPPTEMAPLFPGCDYEHWLIVMDKPGGEGATKQEMIDCLPGVLFVLPDSYVDPENKDYGAELFVNGEIVQRSPERQRRVEPQPQRAQDRPRYNDRTRYSRRKENTR
ncbi:hypothetical protein Bca4012_017633 [Brassica carinata]